MPDVSLREISKAFLDVQALDRVSVDFQAGEIHALLGENGAGKSTLMHLLSGLYRPDTGEIRIDGRPHTFSSPRAALAAGIAMVHQHFMLVPTFTVAENIFLALPGRARDLVRRHTLGRYVQDLAAHYRLTDIEPHARVATLSVGAQQRVEILKALAGQVRILILDEPTAVLTPTEVEALFHTLQRLKHEGYLIILITHKIPEALAISDRISILRRGRLLTTRETLSCTANELAGLLIGDASTPLPPKTTADTASRDATQQPTVPLLTLENLTIQDEAGRRRLDGISLSVHAGEVIGIAGVAGNGQSELAELLIGVRAPQQGLMRFQQQPVHTSPPHYLRARGVSLIPQDRQQEGLALSLSIAENLILNTHLLATLTPGMFLPPNTVQRFAQERITRFGIHTHSPAQPVSTLSGGNQQRVVIARELAAAPQLIVAVNPSRGLDINATHYVHQALLQQCYRGAGVVLISTDLDEVLALSHRVYVLYQGRLLGPVAPTASREVFGRMMTGTWA